MTASSSETGQERKPAATAAAAGHGGGCALLQPPPPPFLGSRVAPDSPASRSAADVSVSLSLATSLSSDRNGDAAAENPLSRLANQLRKLDARTRQATAMPPSAAAASSAAAARASAASAAVAAASVGGGAGAGDGDGESYRPIYCEHGLAYAVYRTLPMRNELDQHLEIAAKRRRKGRVPFAETCFPGHGWMKAERGASRAQPGLRPAPPPGAQAPHGFPKGAGGGGGAASGGDAGSGLGAPRLAPRLSSFAEIERQKTVTYELQTKLKEMLARK